MTLRENGGGLLGVSGLDEEEVASNRTCTLPARKSCAESDRARDEARQNRMKYPQPRLLALKLAESLKNRLEGIWKRVDSKMSTWRPAVESLECREEEREN